MAIALGSELYQLFYNLERDTYAPRCLGKVTARRGDEYFAGGAWRGGFPMFSSREEADAFVTAHPRQTPTIK